MKKIISLFLALTFCVSLGTISINAETVVPNGEWKTCSYNQEDNFIEFVLKEDSVITFECTSPVEDDGDRHTAYLELFYNDGIKAGIRACDSEFLSSINNNPVYKFEYYLKKGAYKFNFQLSYYSSYYGVITAKYKLSSTPLSTRKVKTPKISYVVEDESSNYSNRLKFVWTDDKDYDGIELWTKTNTGKWELKQTATNSDYYRNYGFTSYYYLGNIYYYKIRAYKKCVGFNYYSDFSNVVSMKKLSKPTIKVKSSKKKTATVSIMQGSYGASSYEIFRSTKKNKGFKKVKTVNAKTYNWTNKKLKSKKTYYYKVRAVKKIGKDKIYSAFSSVKKVKAK